ncbi:hypothetical protein BKA56DRAFT_608156 [Ilyonectria sp. MPI-CAGE-AT-0026]|nr:hypothetical protein BKA56DRAFT_608156 [Ilyonectria sp. MPI-CAGE-AT-0026]
MSSLSSTLAFIPYCHLPNCIASCILLYLRDGDKETWVFGLETRDVLVDFPIVGERYNNGAYQGEQYEAIGKLKNTNFGRVTVMGGPDAGKSTLGIEICNAVLAGPPQAHYVKRDSLPLVQTSIVDGAEDDNEDGADGMKCALKWPGTDQMELIRAKINEVNVDMQETMETEDFPAPHDGCIIGSG